MIFQEVNQVEMMTNLMNFIIYTREVVMRGNNFSRKI